jgi:hypothetical protein
MDLTVHSTALSGVWVLQVVQPLMDTSRVFPAEELFLRAQIILGNSHQNSHSRKKRKTAFWGGL